MSTFFRLKTKAELVATMQATARVLLGLDADLSEGSILTFLINLASTSDAEQYVQIAKLLSIFSIYKAKGDDLDERMRDLGSDTFTELRRKAPTTSIGYVLVGDGTTLIRSSLLADTAALDTTFDIPSGEGTNFPSSGAVVLERGTTREETVVYTRLVDTFTIISPPTGMVFPHTQLGEVLRVATKSTLNAAVLAGATTAVLKTGTDSVWPSSGSVIFERGTAREEKRAFTRSGATLTVLALTFAHAINTDLHLSTFGSDRSIPSGTGVYVQASQTTLALYYKATASGTLYDGDFLSELIPIESDAVGVNNNVGSNTITRFVSLPFANATVYNPLSTTGGQNREKDDVYRRRGLTFIQSLSRGTPVAIEGAVIGLEDTATKQRIIFAQVIRPVDPFTTPVYLYLSDGSAVFVLNTVIKSGREVLIADASSGDARAHLNNYGPYQKVLTPGSAITPRLFRSVDRGEATSVGADTLTDATQTWVVNANTGLHLKTDDNQFYEILSNTSTALTLDAGGATPSLGVYCIFDLTADPLVPDTDYRFHEGTGDIELLTVLEEHDGLIVADDNQPGVGAYSYTTGIGALVSQVLYGDRNDIQTYPGVVSAGEKVLQLVPVSVSPTLTIRVVPEADFTDSDIADNVRTTVETYVNSLGIGENIVLSEIVRRVKSLVGVADVQVIDPKANVSVADGQLARITTGNVVVV